MDGQTPKAKREGIREKAVVAVLAAVLAIGLFAVIRDNRCPLAPRTADAGLVAGDPRASGTADEGLAEGGRISSLLYAEPVTENPDRPGGQAAREAVEKLITEQKFEAAAAECARLREDARKSGDARLWTWTLIRESQLRTSLHGYETAVRFFKDEAWPDSPLERDMLDLFYANSLVTYYPAYSWDISRRERVEAKGPIDLKSWTRDRIFEEE